MPDVRERLRNAAALVPVPERGLDRLHERRDRRRRAQRVATVVTALLIAAVVAGGSLALLSGLTRDRVIPGGGDRLTLAPGQSFYLKIESSRAADGWIRHEESWWSTDGSGVIRNTGTRQDKYPDFPSGTYEAGRFPVLVDPSELSTDPAVLEGQLEAGIPFGRDYPVWDAASTLLLQGPNVTPDLRAALVSVLERQDGVETIANATDPAGRPATELRLASHGNHAVWTIDVDPATNQPMAWTSSFEGNAPAWVVIDEGIVDRPGERPTGDEWLVPPA